MPRAIPLWLWCRVGVVSCQRRGAAVRAGARVLSVVRLHMICACGLWPRVCVKYVCETYGIRHPPCQHGNDP
jgi:hypothetical protein